MDRHIIPGKTKARSDSTLLFMNRSEFDYFIGILAYLTDIEEEVLDNLIDTEYLPLMFRTATTEKIFSIYDISTNTIVVLGPKGPASAQAVLQSLDDEHEDYIPPFSLN